MGHVKQYYDLTIIEQHFNTKVFIKRKTRNRNGDEKP